MRLPDPVEERICRDFAPEERDEVRGAMLTYGAPAHEREHERVWLDILELAKGDKARVLELVERAKRDYRDIILWAEYPQESKLDTPEKKRKFNDMLEKFGAAWRIPPGDEGL